MFDTNDCSGVRRSADAEIGNEADVEARWRVPRIACQLQCGASGAGDDSVGVVEGQLQAVDVVFDGDRLGLPEPCFSAHASPVHWMIACRKRMSYRAGCLAKRKPQASKLQARDNRSISSV